jgi:hypothetical protein
MARFNLKLRYKLDQQERSWVRVAIIIKELPGTNAGVPEICARPEHPAEYLAAGHDFLPGSGKPD